MHEFNSWVYAKEIANRFPSATIHKSPLTEGKYVVYVWTQYNEGYWYESHDERHAHQPPVER